MLRFRPHACRDCRTARIASLRTFFDWLAHATNCSPCMDGLRCAGGDHLRHAHLAHRREAGKGDAVCAECGTEVPWAQRLTPIAWAGDSALHIGYQHTGSCARPATQGSVTSLPPGPPQEERNA